MGAESQQFWCWVYSVICSYDKWRWDATAHLDHCQHQDSDVCEWMNEPTTSHGLPEWNWASTSSLRPSSCFLGVPCSAFPVCLSCNLPFWSLFTYLEYPMRLYSEGTLSRLYEWTHCPSSKASHQLVSTLLLLLIVHLSYLSPGLSDRSGLP